MTLLPAFVVQCTSYFYLFIYLCFSEAPSCATGIFNNLSLSLCIHTQSLQCLLTSCTKI